MRLRHFDPNGWLLVIACFAVTLCIGEVVWSFGVFFKSLETEFGWSRGLTSSGYTGLLIAQGMSAIVAGKLADRYKPRRVLFGSACITGPAIMACSLVTNLPQLQLLMIVTGIGAGATVSVPVSTVQRYFNNPARSNIALAVVASGIGMGALVFAPLLNAVINASGWRTAFITAGLMFSLLVGGAAMVMRPTGMQSQKQRNGPAKASSRVRDLIVTPQFMGVTGVFMIAVFAFQTLSVHLMPYATDMSISTSAAAVALGMVGGISVPGRLASGFFAQRIGWGKTLAFSLAGCGLAIMTLPALHAEWMLYCFVAVYGFFHGVRAVATFGTVGRLFGGHSLGEMTGILVAGSNLVGAFGPYVAGRMFDLSGSYKMTFTAVGIVLLLVALASLAIRFESRDS